MNASLYRAVRISMRPRQWLKNLVVFAPLVFSASLFAPSAIANSAIAFVSVCLISSAIYLMNDVLDVEEDRRHPTKKHRPIAAGAISRRVARIFAGIFALAGVALAAWVGLLTFIATLALILVNAVYVLGGKRIAIFDVMLIGTSFVTRVLIGAAAIMVPASAWLLLTLFFLASYLGFTKRVSELRLDTNTRVSLKDYTPAFLDHARSATLAVTLALYTLYTFASPFGTMMVLTIPFVFFGLLRYQAIVDRDEGMNNGPSDHIYLDRQLQITVGLWCIIVLTIILAAP